MAKDERFVRIHKEGSSFSTDRQIWVDKQTGVTYLWMESGYAGGLTPLLGADGKPVISRIPADEG